MTSPDVLHLTVQQLDELLVRLRHRLSPEDYEVVDALVGVLHTVHLTLADKNATIAKLRKILLGVDAREKAGKGSSSTEGVAGDQEGTPPAESGARADDEASAGSSADRDDVAAPADDSDDAEHRPGHGRNGTDQYQGVTPIVVAHPTLFIGATCPGGCGGKLCGGRVRRIVRIVGQPSLAARMWEAQDLRCSSCGESFPLPLPEEARGPKYDETAGAMIALMKYGSGFPLYRLERHQADLGVPLPASVAWEVVRDMSASIAPAFHELMKRGATADLFYNDDTGARILASMSGSRGTEWLKDGRLRTGIFTSAIVAESPGWKIALFFSGRLHAGENLTKLLELRPEEMDAPIQMSDGSSSNVPTAPPTVQANCAAHARQKWVDIAESFPGKCRRVLDDLRAVYRIDARAKKENLAPSDRLALHKKESKPILAALKNWMEAQLEEKHIEPNSAAGQAIAYMLRRWGKLTLFLRKAGAPIDNNICEQALKMAILHRKNALFYKTARGAQVGDLYMSLIHTCRLNGVNAFEYLKELLTHPDAVRDRPAEWLPWTYKAALAKLNSS